MHNIEFPKHFHKTSSDAINIGDNTLEEWIRECLEKIKREDGDFWLIASGNAVVIILKWDDEYTIYVAKNYWECSVFG